MDKLNNTTILPKDARQAIKEFRNNLILKDKNKVEIIMVYGSVVNGEYNPQESDIDIVVLAKDKSIDEDILDIETAVSLKYGVVISALLTTAKEWQEVQRAGYLFPNEVLKGRVIYGSSKTRNKISL